MAGSKRGNPAHRSIPHKPGSLRYFAADEIELRRQGRSRLRFNGGLQETIAIESLLLFGVGAFFKAYVTRFHLTPHDRTFPTPFEVAIYQGDFYITRLILVVWGLGVPQARALRSDPLLSKAERTIVCAFQPISKIRCFRKPGGSYCPGIPRFSIPKRSAHGRAGVGGRGRKGVRNV